MHAAEGCPHARFQEGWKAGPFCTVHTLPLGEAEGSDIAFTPVLPASPGIGAECFLLGKTKKSKQWQKNQQLISASPRLPFCCLGPRGEDVAGGLGLAGAFQSPPCPAGATRRGLMAFVICSEANAGSALRCGTPIFLRRQGRKERSPALLGQAITA